MEYIVHEAKTRLSKLLQQVKAGETVVITSGRKKNPDCAPRAGTLQQNTVLANCPKPSH
jgi:hypothetical protein